ncbi:MAG: helix-turn-helix domain-containing protein [Ignavibacteriales bacterium]|nr:helix-turn-helix domain-containing protein [Ignavibacteriales bacterium]
MNFVVMTQEQLDLILAMQKNPEPIPEGNKKTISQLLNYNEVMKIFGINRVTLWRWIKRGDIKCIRTRKLIYFEREEIDRFIKRRLD